MPTKVEECDHPGEMERPPRSRCDHLLQVPARASSVGVDEDGAGAAEGGGMRVYRLVECETHHPSCNCGLCNNTACEAVIWHAVNCGCEKCNTYFGPLEPK